MLGQDARFECRIRANPLTNHYWMKDGRVIESAAADLVAHVKSSVLNEATSGEGNSKLAAGKYEVITYNQNSHDNVIISALVVKVCFLF